MIGRMPKPIHEKSDPILLMVAGAKGAIASTMGVAIITLDHEPELIRPYLTVNSATFSNLLRPVKMVGWDISPSNLTDSLLNHRVLQPSLWQQYSDRLHHMDIRSGPAESLDFKGQVDAIGQDMADFKASCPNTVPVLVNLLPAAGDTEFRDCRDLGEIYRKGVVDSNPDLAYVVAAILANVPVINFSPNTVEIPAVCQIAQENRIPLAGRDGKTGQTYFKVALASALKARNLNVDGWYSLNILGNADGKNLMNPERAAGKVANKTELLDDILGYRVGADYSGDTHKVHIDYYPPRGDAKEAWDVVDFKGLFGLPMSIRLNFQARDSILAAPMILDLAQWLATLQMAGYGGPISELGFYFKKPLGNNPPLTFQEQTRALEKLATELSK